jgi:lipopolysaccharide export system permease protein
VIRFPLLARYLTRAFLAKMLAVLLGLASLLVLLDLLDRAADVLQRGGMAGIARYILLRLPTMLGQLMPLAVLAGAILAFRQLAGNLEIAAMRALGLGAWRLLRALLPACALAVALQAALQLGIAPRSERALTDWWDSRGEAIADQPIALAQRLWLRNGSEIVAVDSVSLDGSVLAGVLLVRRDADGRVLECIDARRAAFGAEGWVLQQARIIRPAATQPQLAASQAWPDGPSPKLMRELSRPIVAQPLGRLLQGQRGQGSVSRGPAYYATRVQATLAAMLAPLIMLILALPAAFGMPRQEAAFRRGGIGLILGLGYLVVNGVLTALGEAGALGAYAAAWTAPLCFALAGIWRLWIEES